MKTRQWQWRSRVLVELTLDWRAWSFGISLYFGSPAYDPQWGFGLDFGPVDVHVGQLSES